MRIASNIWRALYAESVPVEQTLRECEFVQGMMPIQEFPALLDLACGAGRHAVELAARGYSVVGVDIDPKALEIAAERMADRGAQGSFIALDLRDLGDLQQRFGWALDRREFDGITLFWQSYGFFNVEAQIGLFIQLRRLLRIGGRLIIDIFNRLYYERGANDRELRMLVTPTLPTILAQDETIFSMLGYEDDLRFERRQADIYDPNLSAPGGISGIAANHGLQLIVSCSNYCSGIPATPEQPRMQLVFERRH